VGTASKRMTGKDKEPLDGDDICAFVFGAVTSFFIFG
jgi:hypothetical protein